MCWQTGGSGGGGGSDDAPSPASGPGGLQWRAIAPWMAHRRHTPAQERPEVAAHPPSLSSLQSPARSGPEASVVIEERLAAAESRAAAAEARAAAVEAELRRLKKLTFAGTASDE